MNWKVIQGKKQWPFYLKIRFFFCLCYWLIEETNAAEHYERKKFDLCKDDIYLAQRQICFVQRLQLPSFNLNLRSYGQFLSLFFWSLCIFILFVSAIISKMQQ